MKLYTYEHVGLAADVRQQCWSNNHSASRGTLGGIGGSIAGRASTRKTGSLITVQQD